MNKRDLLAIPNLSATPKMMHLAEEDKLANYTNYCYGKKNFRHRLYMRCDDQGGILQVALYFPTYMRAGSRKPTYRIFIDADNREFLTYDTSNQKWLTAKIDRLPEMTFWPDSASVWIKKAENALIRAYLNDDKGGFDAVQYFQKRIREEELERKHKRQTDPWDKDLEQVPPLPKNWDRWVDKVGIPEQFIFYDYKKGGAKHGYCTYCERDVPIHGKPLHNHEGRCTRCRHKIVFKATGRVGRFFTEKHCVHLLQRCQDGAMIREFWVNRFYSKEKYQNATIYCREDQRIIYPANMEARQYYWGDYKNRGCRWIAGSPPLYYNFYTNNYRDGGCGRVYGYTLACLAGKEFRQTGLVDWIRKHDMEADPRRYLSLVKELPQFEQIWKVGLTKLEQECRKTTYYVTNYILAPQEPSLIRALGLDAQGFRRLRANDGGCEYLAWLQWEKSSGKTISDELIAKFQSWHITSSNLQFIWDRMSAEQAYNYLSRQATETKMEVRQVLTTWKDYLSMANKLGIDTNDEIIYRARLLKQRHDELVLRMQEKDCKDEAVEVLEKYPQVDEICQSIKSKFEYAAENYVILAPNGVKDIIAEGRMLSHCVAEIDRYWDRIQQHESYILFLRRKTAPQLPYYTLEVEPDGTVRQKRTRFDRQDADIHNIEEFLMKWQQIIKERLTMHDRDLAAKSRVLREQEFTKMREDQVVIRTGELAGRSLADVLMADLMEVAA